jgi:hypothetical protein
MSNWQHRPPDSKGNPIFMVQRLDLSIFEESQEPHNSLILNINLIQTMRSEPLLYQIGDEFYHEFFVGGVALCHQEGKSNQGVIVDFHLAGGFETVLVLLQEPTKMTQYVYFHH